jgi:hypothetical protein
MTCTRRGAWQRAQNRTWRNRRMGHIAMCPYNTNVPTVEAHGNAPKTAPHNPRLGTFLYAR